jgi:hypothetical protein
MNSSRVSFDEAAEQKLAAQWGGTVEGFPCPIPDHKGRAKLIEQQGDLRLACSCSDRPDRWRSLGEVCAAQAYGVDDIRTNIEIATWTRRLAWELKVFEKVEVSLPELPPGLPGHVDRVRQGFKTSTRASMGGP